MQIPILFGRSFTDLDRPGAPGVAVINERMARRYFGTPNAVGRRFRVDPSGDASDGRPGTELEVIGIVPDVRTSTTDVAPRPMFYRSFVQEAAATPTVVVRTTADPVGLLQPMRQVLRDLGDELPLIRVRTMREQIAESLGVARMLASPLGGLGALGLALASLGLYAIMAFAVSRRTREIGIRRALGARQTHVMWTVSRGVATLLAAGIAIGLGLSWIMVRWSAAMSASVSRGGGVGVDAPSAGVVSCALVAAFITAVGLAATLVPARRAAHADPLVALRQL